MQTPDNEDHRTYRTILPAGLHRPTTLERPAKRQRLTLACNECRKRKIRCDAEIPRCNNCRTRDIICETTDPKHPELVVVRKYGFQDKNNNELGHEQDSLAQTIPEHPNISRGTSGPSSDIEQQYDNAHIADRPTSWIARSYSLSGGHVTFENNTGAQQLPEENESPEMAINRDHSADRQKLMGGSSLQSVTMFLDLYLHKSGRPRIGHCFRHGMSFAEEMLLPLQLQLPDLPPTSLMETYFKAYERNIHPLFPILELDQFRNDLQRIQSYQDSSWSPLGGFAGLTKVLHPTDVPTLACIYGVISLGANESADKLTDVGQNFLSAAHGLYAHLIGLPHLSSVQALLLIMLGLRGNGKEGQGFQVLGSAIRIAHSIGIHRRIGSNRKRIGANVSVVNQKKSELHSKIWWTMFSLEKLMELETTRPSSIPHGQHDQYLPAKILPDEAQKELKYFIHWVSLSKILEQISELLYRRRRGVDSTLYILQSISKIDSALRVWKNNLPEDIQPDGDLYCDSSERPFAAFLALQYHQTLITLHRASLILPHNQFIEDIQTHITDLPFHQRLRSGEALCTASARAMIRINAQTPGRIQTPLYTLTQTLHGCVVLALYIMRQPDQRTVCSDLELVVTGAELAEAEYKKLGMDPKFIESCKILRTSMSAHVRQYQGSSLAEASGTYNTSVQPAPTSCQVQSNERTNEFTNWNLDPFTFDDASIDFTSIFEGTGLEDLWMVGADVDIYSPVVPYQ